MVETGEASIQFILKAEARYSPQVLVPSRISTLRIFFRDLQEWELIPRRFDPMRHLTTPKSLVALIGPNPRIIADDVWAKLVWAGLNLVADDLPVVARPIEGTFDPTVIP